MSRVMYDQSPMDVLVGDGYVRTCGGIESETVDIVVTEDRIGLELGSWMGVPLT